MYRSPIAKKFNEPDGCVPGTSHFLDFVPLRMFNDLNKHINHLGLSDCFFTPEKSA